MLLGILAGLIWWRGYLLPYRVMKSGYFERVFVTPERVGKRSIWQEIRCRITIPGFQFLVPQFQISSSQFPVPSSWLHDCRPHPIAIGKLSGAVSRPFPCIWPILQGFLSFWKNVWKIKTFITFASPKEKFFLNPENRERGIWEIK